MCARDVQILFADAATGARSPALVHQGKIGEIIQAKPEQRRRVLEDAAGVAGLHARRHEAELRLKAAETNLTRVEDVIGQLAGQIDGLKSRHVRRSVTAKLLPRSARPKRCCSICAGCRPMPTSMTQARLTT
jgi:chromosome segregation protein